MSENEPLEKIGSLWKKQSKGGVAYLSGVIDGRRVVVFQARDRKSDKSPDYQVFLSRSVQPEAAQPASGDYRAEDSDIPF